MLFLLLQLGDERYAIAAAEIVEVLPAIAVRPIAHAPAGVAGIVTYRGKPVPVVDLARIVLSRDAERRLSTRLIVVTISGPGGEPQLLGLIAERVTEVLRSTPGDFQPSGVHCADAPYLGGVVRLADSLVQRLELERLLPPAIQAALFQSVVSHAAR
jgi:chemotaxis-related protein WspB